jgi:hypothetical protein
MGVAIQDKKEVTRMAMWKKALALVVASLVVALPVVTQVSVAQTVPTQKQEAQVVLPQGKELSDTKLQETEGEGPLSATIGAVLGGAFEYGMERAKGEKVNLGAIALSAAYGAAMSGFVPDAQVIKVGVRAVRWAARAVAAVGPKAMSFGQKIAYGFNHYIGGPLIRLLTRRR